MGERRAIARDMLATSRKNNLAAFANLLLEIRQLLSYAVLAWTAFATRDRLALIHGWSLSRMLGFVYMLFGRKMMYEFVALPSNLLTCCSRPSYYHYHRRWIAGMFPLNRRRPAKGFLALAM